MPTITHEDMLLRARDLIDNVKGLDRTNADLIADMIISDVQILRLIQADIKPMGIINRFFVPLIAELELMYLGDGMMDPFKVVCTKDPKTLKDYIDKCIGEDISMVEEKKNLGLLLGYPPGAAQTFAERMGNGDHESELIVNYHGQQFNSYNSTIVEDLEWLKRHIVIPQDLKLEFTIKSDDVRHFDSVDEAIKHFSK